MPFMIAKSTHLHELRNLLHELWLSDVWMSCDMRFPTMWYVRPTKAQTSLRIPAVWSEPLLVAWIFHECQSTNLTAFRVSKLIRRLLRLGWVYTCQNTKLLEITCQGSYGQYNTLFVSFIYIWISSLDKGCQYGFDFEITRKPLWSGLRMCTSIWSLFTCAQMHVIRLCGVYNVAH